MLIKQIIMGTYLPSRLFPKKAELIVVDLDLEFQVGIDQVMIRLIYVFLAVPDSSIGDLVTN